MNTLRKPLPRNNKKPFTVTTSSQIELDVDCETGWNKVVNVENHPAIIPTVYLVEPLDDNFRQVGHKVKITRNLRSGHVYTGTYTMIKVDTENRECQFYSDDLGPSNAICSTTWQISPTQGEGNNNNPQRCVLTISIAVVPDSMLIYAGRLVFVPLIKRLTKNTIKEDLKDFAAHCSEVVVKRDDTALLGEQVLYQDQISATEKNFTTENSISATVTTEDSISAATEKASKTEHSSHDEHDPILTACSSPVAKSDKTKFITRPSDDPRLIAKEVHNVTIGRKLRDAWFNSQ